MEFFQHVDIEKFLARKERELWRLTGDKDKFLKSLNMLHTRIDQARTQWACISAKSQREKKFKSKNGVRNDLNIYHTLTTITPKYERIGGIEPPDRTGKHLFKFSKRSRQRLMSKARKLNKSNLPKPYIVTLTYHKNFKYPKKAKAHLNAFLQRWRRRDDGFAYFWKMEPQKRGAVHFHLAIFVQENVKNTLVKRKRGELESKGLEINALNALRLTLQEDWANVTKNVDGIKVPYTKIDYVRKRKSTIEKYVTEKNVKYVKTKCRNPRLRYKAEPDIQHELYGTNVREVDNWKMFLGYVYKYIGKEVGENPFKQSVLNGVIQSKKLTYRKAPYITDFPIDMPTKTPDTGRFWGFSYNLDFDPLKTRIVDHKDIENLNDFCNALNALTFAELTEHLRQNAIRKRKELKDQPKKLKKKLQHYRAIYEKQKKRYVINKEKIKKGYSMQFEIDNDTVMECEQYLKSKSVAEFFDYP